MAQSTPPNLNDLMTSFLTRQNADRLNGAESVLTGEVEAYEAVPAQSVDPRLAWNASAEVMSYVAPNNVKNDKLPVGWSQLVAGLESACALPMAIGNFPQAVRDLLPLVRADKLSSVTETKKVTDEAGVGNVAETASKTSDPSQWLLSAALLRLTGKCDSAEQLLNAKQNSVSTEWKTALINESAAVAWARGDRLSAIRFWKTLPEGMVRSFNLGMAMLFTDQTDESKAHLQTAVNSLSEASPWHHLARLYLALAESR